MEGSHYYFDISRSSFGHGSLLKDVTSSEVVINRDRLIYVRYASVGRVVAEEEPLAVACTRFLARISRSGQPSLQSVRDR